jgi:peptidoglycan/LPS O-acetylase OafA/YrhL
LGSLRFLLALGVATGHIASLTATTIDQHWLMGGSRAVQIFYMISGFLMALILNGKYPKGSAGNRLFWTNRLVKILVPYLVALAFSIALGLLALAVTGNGTMMLNPWLAQGSTMTWSTWAYAVLTNLFIVGQEWGFLLIYRAGSLFYSFHAYEQPPLAAQFIVDLPSWTLSIELMFYAIAPFILRRHVLVIAAIACASHVLRFESYHLGYYSEATNYRFFPFEISLFLYGAVCFKLGKILSLSDTRVTNALVAVALAIIVLKPTYLIENQFKLYFLIGVLLPSLFDFSRRYRWDHALGDVSFPLYLVHFPIGAFAGAMAEGFVAACVSVVASIAAAIILDRYVVVPIDRWRQSRALKMQNEGQKRAPNIAVQVG